MQIPQPLDDFSFFDGVKIIHADPLAIFRILLIRTRGKPNELADKVYGSAPDETDLAKLAESWQAAEDLVQLVRELFQMQPFDPATGRGARDEHCWAVWDGFCSYMSEQKKTPAPPPTPSSPSAQADTAQLIGNMSD
jgi:hypothetical protein